jgi:hypothetical protein
MQCGYCHRSSGGLGRWRFERLRGWIYPLSIHTSGKRVRGYYAAHAARPGHRGELVGEGRFPPGNFGYVKSAPGSRVRRGLEGVETMAILD